MEMWPEGLQTDNVHFCCRETGISSSVKELRVTLKIYIYLYIFILN